MTYDCAFLEPLALPPDLPPPVILSEVFGVWKVGKSGLVVVESVKDAKSGCGR